MTNVQYFADISTLDKLIEQELAKKQHMKGDFRIELVTIFPSKEIFYFKLQNKQIKGRNRRWDDSDEASETSSICSERSFSSSIGGTRVTEVRVSVNVLLLTT